MALVRPPVQALPGRVHGAGRTELGGFAASIPRAKAGTSSPGATRMTAYLNQREDVELLWLPYWVLMKKAKLFLPGWSENRAVTASGIPTKSFQRELIEEYT